MSEARSDVTCSPANCSHVHSPAESAISEDDKSDLYVNPWSDATVSSADTSCTGEMMGDGDKHSTHAHANGEGASTQASRRQTLTEKVPPNDVTEVRDRHHTPSPLESSALDTENPWEDDTAVDRPHTKTDLQQEDNANLWADTARPRLSAEAAHFVPGALTHVDTTLSTLERDDYVTMHGVHQQRTVRPGAVARYYAEGFAATASAQALTLAGPWTAHLREPSARPHEF